MLWRFSMRVRPCLCRRGAVGWRWKKQPRRNREEYRVIRQQTGFGVDTEFVAQFLRALVCTVGNGNELGIFGGKISGHQLNHFACTDKEDVQIGNGREDLLCILTDAEAMETEFSPTAVSVRTSLATAKVF